MQVCEYKLENKHFEAALKTVKPTASEADIYKRFAGTRA
ncbi:MAG: hypothetical protein NTU95_12240 [Methanothrix sp.]|nr:hypothetical protein [Methanothrix sp.]